MEVEKRYLSVCIPTYRREAILERLLNTIPTQDVEVIISDNGGFLSNDFKHRFNHVNIISTKIVLPMFSNWNNAIKPSRLPYVIIPSDDDLFTQEAFNIIHFYIEQYPDINIFVFGHHLIDADDNIIGTWCPRLEHIYAPPYGFNVFRYGVEARMPSIVFKKDLLDKLDYFDESFTTTAADSDLIQRALLYGKAMFIPKVISCYRVWPGSTTSEKQASDEWIEQVKHWTDKVSILAEKQFYNNGEVFNALHYRDEILARNLISAMRNFLSQNRKSAAKTFIKKYGIPLNALLCTKFKLVKMSVRAYL